MRLPSVDTIQNTLDLDRKTALKVRRLLDGRLDPPTFESAAIRARWRSFPTYEELVMCALDEVLEGNGVGLIWNGSDLIAEYVNMGDTYTPTILYDYTRETYHATSWGDWFEAYEQRG